MTMPNDPTVDYVCPRTRRRFKADPISGRLLPHENYRKTYGELRWSKVDGSQTDAQRERTKKALAAARAKQRAMRESGIKPARTKGLVNRFLRLSDMKPSSRRFIEEFRAKYAGDLENGLRFLAKLHEDPNASDSDKIRATTDFLKIMLHPEMNRSEATINHNVNRKVTFDDPEQARRVAAAFSGAGEIVDAGTGLPGEASGGPAQVPVRLLPRPEVGDDDPEGRGEEPGVEA